MRLAQFLDGIRQQRDNDIINKLKGVQPYLQAEIARRDKDAQILKTRDKAIGDAGVILSSEGYEQNDIDEFKQGASQINNPDMVVNAVNSFRERKALVKALESRGVKNIPKNATVLDLQDMYNQKNASFKNTKDLEDKVQMMGLGDEWSKLIAEDGLDPEVAYSKVIGLLPEKEADIKAKSSLGSEYYKMYQEAVKKGTPKTQALIDATTAMSRDEYEVKQKTQLKFSKGSGGGGASGTSVNLGKEYITRRDKVKPDVTGGFVYYYDGNNPPQVVKTRAYLDDSGVLRIAGLGHQADVEKLIPRSEVSSIDKQTAREVVFKAKPAAKSNPNTAIKAPVPGKPGANKPNEKVNNLIGKKY